MRLYDWKGNCLWSTRLGKGREKCCDKAARSLTRTLFCDRCGTGYKIWQGLNSFPCSFLSIFHFWSYMSNEVLWLSLTNAARGDIYSRPFQLRRWTISRLCGDYYRQRSDAESRCAATFCCVNYEHDDYRQHHLTAHNKHVLISCRCRAVVSSALAPVKS